MSDPKDVVQMGQDYTPELKAATYPIKEGAAPEPPRARTLQDVLNAKAKADAELKNPVRPGGDVEEAEPDRVARLEAAVNRLLGGTKTSSGPAKVLGPMDFANLSEEAAYDLSIPIQAIDHGLPESMKVELSDPNYVPRWVHTHPKRLGPMKAVGFTIVTQEDLAVDLNLELEVDENGAFRYSDVILMKIPKIKYFGALRRNHENAVRAVNEENAHAAGRKAIEDYLEEKGGNAYVEAHNKKRMNVYTPGTTV